MCSGHAFGVYWIDLEDQRRAGGMLLGCLGVLGGLLEVPWGPLGVSWEVLGCLGGPGSVLGSPWGAVGVILGSGAILGSVLGGQNVDISLVLGGILRCYVFS